MIEHSCRIYAGLVAAILLVSIASSMPHFASAATSPPVITVPLPITVFPTSSEGALVTYLNVTATGDESISQVSCNPTSGSLFHIGTTTVNCTATDAEGNIGSGSFTITVMPPSQTSTTLTVNTQDSNGNPINGMRVWLETYSGDVIKQAFTPHTFTIKTDTPYKVVLANFRSNVFDHWQDQASNTDRHRIILVDSDKTLVGVYSGKAGSTSASDLTVLSTDSNGNSINGMRVWLETYSGDVIKQAFTPHTFTIKTDTPYKVVLANFGSIVFDHWQDQTNNTDRHRIILVDSDTTLVGVYSGQGGSTNASELTVLSTDSNGNPINGMRVWLETYSGDVITQAFTPHTFTIKTDTPYKVVLANFGSIIFDHWQDQANNTDRHRIISINSDTTLNGVYSDQDDSHKKGKKDTDKDDDDKEKKCEPGKNDKYEKYEHVCNGDIDITKWRGRDAQ